MKDNRSKHHELAMVAYASQRTRQSGADGGRGGFPGNLMSDAYGKGKGAPKGKGKGKVMVKASRETSKLIPKTSLKAEAATVAIKAASRRTRKLYRRRLDFRNETRG